MDSDDHAPWHYTEFGVVCACGAAMDSDENCTALTQDPDEYHDALVDRQMEDHR